MRRDDAFYHVVELLQQHKDLQQLPHCNNIEDFLSEYFIIPEEGRLGVYGKYRIGPKHILVTLWNTQKFRFTWKRVSPHLKYPSFNYLF